MNETGILLASAHKDIVNAHNILMMVQIHAIKTTIEDTMYAYMIAKDWCEWIAKPDSPNNPLQGSNVSSIPTLGIFQIIAQSLEDELKENKIKVRDTFVEINPNLVSLLRSPNPMVKEMTTLYFRSLRCTAKLFDKNLDERWWGKVLDSKYIPPM